MLPIGAIALANAYFGYQHYRDQIAGGVIAAGEDVLRREEAIVARANDLASTLAAISLGRPDTVQQCRQTLVKLLSLYSEFSNISVLDRNGFVACSAIEGLGGGAETTPPAWFRDALNGRPFTVSGSPEGPVGGEPAVIGAMPLVNETNEVTGVLAISIRTTALEQTMRDIGLPEGGGMIVLDRFGQTIAQRANQITGDTWLPPDPLGTEEGGRSSGVFDATGRDGIERRYVLTPLAGDLFAFFAMPLATVGDAAHFLLYSNAASALFMWLAALVTATLAVNRLVTRPLRRIRHSIVAYSHGDDRARIGDIDGLPGEVQSLAGTFNQMADAIAARDEALRESVEQQKALTREVHHRVRNNLQIVNSLMNLQNWRAATPSELAIFSEVQRRVTALGLVHGALYQGDDMRSVRLRTLLKDLCAATEQSLSEIDHLPLLLVEADDLAASADIAVPLAFLVTEIVGEAMLGRSDNPPPNQIRIRLEKAEPGAILTVEADRPLFGEPGEDAAKRHGLSLLSGLVRQLAGIQQVNTEQTSISVSIPNLTAAAK